MWPLLPLQTFRQDYNHASHSTLLRMLFLYKSGETHILKAIPKQIFWEIFHENFFYWTSGFLPEICREEGAWTTVWAMDSDNFNWQQFVGLKKTNQFKQTVHIFDDLIEIERIWKRNCTVITMSYGECFVRLWFVSICK